MADTNQPLPRDTTELLQLIAIRLGVIAILLHKETGSTEDLSTMYQDQRNSLT